MTGNNTAIAQKDGRLRFDGGRLVIAPEVRQRLLDATGDGRYASQVAISLFHRHLDRRWGPTPEADAVLNEFVLSRGTDRSKGSVIVSRHLAFSMELEYVTTIGGDTIVRVAGPAPRKRTGRRNRVIVS